MKRFKQLRRVNEDFDPKEVEVANKTSRSAGAVSSKALVPRHIEQHGNKEHEHLDFGAGKDAVHAKHLREKGFKVTAHEFGSNQKEGVHDPKALHKKYDHVYASNVLNVQGSHHMLRKTLDQIHKATKPGGHFTGNLPESPRKFHELNHELVHHELKKRFHDVKVVGGTKKAPVYHATGPKEKIDESYDGISNAAMTLKEKPNKEPTKKLKEENDTKEKNEMAQTQLHFLKYAAEEINEYISMGGQIEEWYQNKLSKVHSDMEGLHSWVEGEKRRTGMVKEESDQLDEVSKDTVRSYLSKAQMSVPKDEREYKSRSKGIERAEKRLAKEDVEQLDEISPELLGRYKEKAKKSADELSASKQYKKSTDRWGNIMRATGKEIKHTTEKLRKLRMGEEVVEEGGNKEMKGKDPCWKGYEMVGTKKKGGKEVPNCVPVKEDADLSEMVGANMNTRDLHQHVKKQGWKLSRTSGSHDVYEHPKSDKHISIPRHKNIKAPLVLGILKTVKSVREEIELQESNSSRLSLIKEIAKKAIEKKKVNREDQFNPDPVLSSKLTKT